VDWQRALAAAAKQANDPGLLDQFATSGATMGNIPVDVWVDADNLLRRMTMSFSMTEGPQEAAGTLRLELFDYGKPVTVDTPAAADVVDALSLNG
jgi:hypothetical protein